MSGADSLLLILRRKTSPTTIAHRNIKGATTKGFESGDTTRKRRDLPRRDRKAWQNYGMYLVNC